MDRVLQLMEQHAVSDIYGLRFNDLMDMTEYEFERIVERIKEFEQKQEKKRKEKKGNILP